MIKVCIHCSTLHKTPSKKCPSCAEPLYTLEVVCDLAYAHQRDLEDREDTYLYGVEDDGNT